MSRVPISFQEKSQKTGSLGSSDTCLRLQVVPLLLINHTSYPASANLNPTKFYDYWNSYSQYCSHNCFYLEPFRGLIKANRLPNWKDRAREKRFFQVSHRLVREEFDVSSGYIRRWWLNCGFHMDIPRMWLKLPDKSEKYFWSLSM